MNVAAILAQIEYFERKYPREAVAAAVSAQEEITPELLRILAETTDRAEKNLLPSNYIGHMYALYLLAEFRETQAYPLVLRMSALPAETVDDLLNDTITEDLSRIIASVFDGDPSGIHRLIEDDAVEEFVRAAAISSLVVLVVNGRISREAVIDYFRELFHGKLKRERSYVIDGLVIHACELYGNELFPEIEKVYSDGLVDPDTISLNEVRQKFAMDKDVILEQTFQNKYNHLIDDTIVEMSDWGCFVDDDIVRPAGHAHISAPQIPSWKKPPKIGRNDPCPCYSGKKYKKCCGAD